MEFFTDNTQIIVTVVLLFAIIFSGVLNQFLVKHTSKAIYSFLRLATIIVTVICILYNIFFLFS